jgi:hypothetical protein
MDDTIAEKIHTELSRIATSLEKLTLLKERETAAEKHDEDISPRPPAYIAQTNRRGPTVPSRTTGLKPR